MFHLHLLYDILVPSKGGYPRLFHHNVQRDLLLLSLKRVVSRAEGGGYRAKTTYLCAPFPASAAFLLVLKELNRGARYSIVKERGACREAQICCFRGLKSSIQFSGNIDIVENCRLVLHRI